MFNYIYTSFSQQITSWLKDHLLPCPFKYFTHIDCPGCGFQRSVVALLQGDMQASLTLYPATIPLIITGVYFLIDKKIGIDTKQHLVKKALYLIVGSFILVTYSIKMWHLYRH